MHRCRRWEGAGNTFVWGGGGEGWEAEERRVASEASHYLRAQVKRVCAQPLMGSRACEVGGVQDEAYFTSGWAVGFPRREGTLRVFCFGGVGQRLTSEASWCMSSPRSPPVCLYATTNEWW